MLKCKEVSEIIAVDRFDEATWTRRLSIRLHLVMCRHCRRYASQVRALGDAARELWSRRDDPGDSAVFERLKAVILKDVSVESASDANGAD